MQLQIQTKIVPNAYFQTKETQNVKGLKNLLKTQQNHFPSQQLLTQLRQIQLNAKAYYFHLSCLRNKSFQIIIQEDYQFQLFLMQKVFIALKENLLEKKICKNAKMKFIQSLKIQIQINKYKQQKTKKADDLRNTSVMKRIFNQMLILEKLSKKSRVLQNFLKRSNEQQFLYIIKQVKREQKSKKLKQEQTYKQIEDIYRLNVMKRYFISLDLNSKVIKLQRKRKQKCLVKFVQKLIEIKKETNEKIQKFITEKQYKLKVKYFQLLKQTRLSSQCSDWHKYRLIKFYFKKWIHYLENEKNINDIQKANEIILKHYVQSKQQKIKINLLKKHFNLWKLWIYQQKSQKNEEKILNSFAQIKQKQYLQRKYFQLLKTNVKNQRSLRFHHNKLFLKSFQSLKNNLILQSKKLGKVLQFIEQRTLKRYFKGIKIFVKNQNKKVHDFLIKKYWFHFTLRVTLQYFQKQQKAKNYYNTLLMFKSIISLKENVQISKKASYCAFYINVVTPMKKIISRFRIKHFYSIKKFQMLKKIFFQWKLMTLRKQLSEKRKKEIQNEKFGQNDIQSSYPMDKNQNKVNQQESFSDMIVSKIRCDQQEGRLNNFSQQQTSFFHQVHQSSDLSGDQIQRKVDKLLSKIKSQRKRNTKQETKKELIQNLSNVSKRSFPKQTTQKLRLPTWSSPGNATQCYRVSVFEDQDENQN